MAWTVDGYDFHTISLSVSNLASYYGRGREEITTSITLTLLFRYVYINIHLSIHPPSLYAQLTPPHP